MASRGAGQQMADTFSTRGALSRLVQRLRSRRVQRQRTAFLRRFQPGVFVVESPPIASRIVRQAEAAGFFVAQINGSVAETRTAFLNQTARLLQFPDYFGHNWDAFDECIRDLEWLPASGYVIIWDHFERFAELEQEDWKIALSILERAVDYWRQAGTPMFVFLAGPSSAAADIPGLTQMD